MKLDCLDIRTCGPMDAEVKCGRSCNRVAKVRKVCINQGDIPSNARDRTLKGIHERHISFRMNMNKKYTQRPLNMEGGNDGRLNLPKGKLRVVVKKSMRM